MVAADPSNRVTGLLLLLAFVAFAVGASLPLFGEKGNARIYNLPTAEYLRTIGDNALIWRWANVFMAAAAVILLAGLTLLTGVLDSAGERVLSHLGLVGFALAAVLWVIFSAWRATTTVVAAQETLAAGTVPSFYEPLAQLGYALFYAYALVGFLALMAYGGSLLQVDLLPAWVGWATLVFSAAMLVVLVITGDNLPAFHYLPGVVIGILLVLQG